MSGIIWGKLSGKNRGAAARKCERFKSQNSGKGKEGNQGIKRGLFHSLCSKSSVIDHLCRNSLQEEEMAQNIDACKIKATLGSQSVHRKKLGACEKGIDAEIGEDGSAKCKVDCAAEKGMCVSVGAESMKQGTCDYECMEDVKQGKREIECKEDVKQEDAVDVTVKQGILAMEQGGNMVYVELNSSVKKENRINSPAKCIHKDEDATKAADKGLNSESTRSKPDMEQKDVYVSASSELVVSSHDFVGGISKKAMAVISTWHSQSCDSVLKSADHSFASCVSSFSSRPNSLTPQLLSPYHHMFVSCSSFSVSRLLEEAELYRSCSSSSMSLPKLLLDAEVDSLSSSTLSALPDSTPEHLTASSIHNFRLMPSSAGSPSSCWDQGKHEIGMRKHRESTDSMLRYKKACTYLVSKIKSLVSDLESEYLDIQRSAAAELRLLAKHDDSKRLLIASTGALRPLVASVRSRDRSIQIEATTAVLNLSLNHFLRNAIVKEGAIGALVGVLRDGSGAVAAKENAAMALACLAHSDQHKIKIGLAGAVKPLVSLLETGSARGKKDAAAALYRLSAHDLNKCRIVRAGASRPLVGYMSDEQDKDGMADKAIAILGNLVSIEEGRVAFVEEKGISALMQVLRTGSERSKRLAVCILSQLCTHSSKHRSLVLQKKPFPTLMALSKIGNIRYKMQVAKVIQALIVDAD